MQNNEGNGSSDGKDMLYVAGGLALIVLGAGMIVSHPAIRRSIAAGLSSVLPDLQGKFGPDLSTLGPDIQRYMKIKSM
jgi:hypothetical protein